MSDRWIKITSLIAMVIAIVVFLLSLMAICCGFFMSGGINEMLQGSLEHSDPDNPGDGWLVLGGVFGSIIGGFAAAFLAAMGIIGIIAVILLGAPILIGWIIWKKTGNRKAYTICFSIPLAIVGLCILASYVSDFLGNFSIVSINQSFLMYL